MVSRILSDILQAEKTSSISIAQQLTIAKMFGSKAMALLLEGRLNQHYFKQILSIFHTALTDKSFMEEELKVKTEFTELKKFISPGANNKQLQK